MTSTVARVLGVDISKDTLDVHLHPDGESRRFLNTQKGFTALIAWLGGRELARIVYEPTGAYHRSFETRLLEAGFPLSKVNPRQARRFAQAIGTNVKTDAVDAAMLARFGAMIDLRVLPQHSAALSEMKELLVARRALTKDRVAVQNRSHQHRLPLLQNQAAQRLCQIDLQIEALDAALRTLLSEEPALKACYDILLSIPGIGETTAIALLVETPELGELDHKHIASLAGLAPITRESGQWRGKRFIGGGRRELRHALYMPAVSAIRHNPDLAEVYKRLRAKGKPAKVALVAVMRKLLVIANALLRKGLAWTPNPA